VGKENFLGGFRGIRIPSLRKKRMPKWGLSRLCVNTYSTFLGMEERPEMREKGRDATREKLRKGRKGASHPAAVRRKHLPQLVLRGA